MLHSDSPYGFECHLQVGPSRLSYLVYPFLSCLWACVSVCTLLCTHACLFMCDYMFVYVQVVFCVSVFARAPLCRTVNVSDCFFISTPPTAPFLSVSRSLANPHSRSPFFLSPFHSPSSSPALSPSSSLCNNSADLVSACSVLPVEFYSGLPSWLLCCLKTQAEKHD